MLSRVELTALEQQWWCVAWFNSTEDVENEGPSLKLMQDTVPGDFVRFLSHLEIEILCDILAQQAKLCASKSH